MGENYADPKYGLEQTLGLGILIPTVSGAAAEEIARWRFFTDVKVKEARAVMKVAGKGATSGFDIHTLVGTTTTSIGQILVGTTAAGGVVDATLTDTDLESDDSLILTNIVATDTQASVVGLQFQERFEL